MPRFKVILEAQSPLLLSDILPAGNVQSSRLFVAGSVLRGAIAKAILSPLGLWRHSGQPIQSISVPEQFHTVFLKEPCARFGFLYPVREAGNMLGDREAFPLPLTVYTCKTHKGFAGQGGHGVFDRLMEMLRQEAGGKTGGRVGCPECDERLDRMRGYGTRSREDGANTYAQVKIAPRSFVRVGLNRMTETAEERILYTLEALVPGTGREGEEKPLSFVGYWVMSPDQWKALQELLKQHNLAQNGTCLLRIGTARARGMGLVRLYLQDMSTELPAVEAKLDAFQPKDEKGEPLDRARLYFALTLRAPVLLYDSKGQPTTTITPELLKAYVSQVPGSLEFLSKASVMEQEIWTGWSPAWGLPKPVTPAMAAGSVLAFRAPMEERNAVLAFLQEIEENGLGERLAEGWGEVVACDPFHIIFDYKGGSQ